MKKHVLASSVLALSFAGCAGGGGGLGSTTPAPTAFAPTSAKTVPVTVTVRWPTPAGGPSSRGRHYVSNGTKSITIVVDSGMPTIVNNPNLSPGTASAPTQTTTVLLAVAPGTPTFTISDYDALAGAGKLLAQSTMQETVSLDVANVIGFTLDGNLASIDEQAVPNVYLNDAKPTYTVVGPATQTFNLVPRDADGYTIIAPGVVPTIATTSATPTSVSVTASATTNQIYVKALAAEASVVLTAVGYSLSGTKISTPFTIKTLGALAIVDQQNFALKIFDENGNLITTPGGFPGLHAGLGVTYVPASGTTPDELFVSDSGLTGSGPYVHPYDLLGNAVSVPAGGFPNLEETAYWRYFPTFGQFYVPGSNKASIYDSGGNFVKYFQPSAFVGIDLYPAGNSGAGEFFATGNSRVVGMSAAGTVLSTTSANGFTGNPPFTQGNGIAYDSNNGDLFVAGLDGTTGYGTVLEFSTALAAVTHSPTAFTDLSNPTTPGIPYPAGIAFDPANKEFYVTNYRAKTGTNTQTAVYVFTEAGAAATNVVTGGFAGLNEPTDLVFLP